MSDQQTNNTKAWVFLAGEDQPHLLRYNAQYCLEIFVYLCLRLYRKTSLETKASVDFIYLYLLRREAHSHSMSDVMLCVEVKRLVL